ncbi:MAG: type II CRISPR-associated endonuclease Cas1 [Eubacteriales bacterium]|nr:type II CRISPR-associated endonuclease Cas1 [Eubacteriales bacterium]
MSWRTVVISHRAKLDYKLDYMVVRGEDTNKVHLSEMFMLLIASTEVSLTAALLSELSKRKIKVIFCDEKRNPISELVSYYGSHDTSLKVREQIRWSEGSKGNVWTEIVTEKIRKQKELLDMLGKNEAKLLEQYIEEITYNDETNREGHAAKVYFNALFGKGFARSLEVPVNAALNYGYSIILSAVNREIVKSGYITQLGLCHDNRFNPFNLGSDLMEPLRPIVDRRVIEMMPEKFEHEEKAELLQILNTTVYINGRNQYLNNAIGIYCRSVFDALQDSDISEIKFWSYEL